MERTSDPVTMDRICNRIMAGLYPMCKAGNSHPRPTDISSPKEAAR
ncbi:hypothetical protein ABI_41530 [Asticcacaulis biprosthecium C19]|uniref:Uncharacterized protein n=1 Tax=Asticcacaulis biprosthecium C19 TaxID=715226 RepID=F4QSK9_9CAUL|nr:hypothetical protein ABI_41530 [Asticcacaulis biprosthecium C19]